MIICKNNEELNAVTDNTVIGAENINMQNSEIRFAGSGNILFAEENVNLSGTKLFFNGSNSVVYLSSSGNAYRLNVSINNACSLFIGNNNFMNGTLNITISEHTNVFLGDDNLLAFGIWVRTADPHLIYSAETKKRINPSKSIFIGDHVWIGQDVHVLKGTQVASGSILGAGTVCPGKKTGSNQAWGGNPAKKISEGIFWERTCCHAFTEEDTKNYDTKKSDEHIYGYSKDEYIPFDDIDNKLNSLKSAREKLECLTKLSNSKTKNRFVPNDGNQKAEKRGLFHR